ncbi:MAG: nucleoside deaminase [Candidatus Dormibacteria bacterium]
MPSGPPPGANPWTDWELGLMRHCLRLARAAGRRGEVPVGALVEWGGQVLGVGSNRVEAGRDASRHAELLALRAASRRAGGWRLEGATLYSTLEPCPMCAGAALLARVSRVVYGALDPRKGADQSAYDVLSSPSGNHHPQVASGCLAEESAALLQGFFQRLRP